MRLLLASVCVFIGASSSAFAQGTAPPGPTEQPVVDQAPPDGTLATEGNEGTAGTESVATPVVSDVPAPAPVEPVETPQEREARSRFEAGRALVQVGSFSAARTEFQRGFEFSERPLFLFNMAECARHLEQRDIARREYSEYLRMEPTGAFASIARERVAELGPGDTSTPEFVAAMRYPDGPPAAPSASLAAAAAETVPEANAADEPTAGRKWYASWPFWTVVGLVLVGSAVAVGIATRPGSPECGQGCGRVDWSDL